jgi:hypothetical protein
MMQLVTKQLREYAAKVLQAADLLDDLSDLGTKTIPDKTIPELEPKPRRRMSQAARHRIAVAQRKRWRLIRGGRKAA